MDVLLTGGSGFVGAHTVRALVDDGHRVRLLVRDASRVAPALEPLGLDPATLEVVVGDVTDRAAVRAGLDGVDSVVHAAAVFSVDARHREVMRSTNAAAAEAVLTQAVEAGADPVVHVSSIVSLLRSGGGRIDNRSPMGDLGGAYNDSKRASDVVARGLQAAGAPVHRVHPGAMLGPHDPHLGTTDRILRDVLRGRYPTWPKGRMGYGDVRDAAATIAAVVQRRGSAPSAWVCPTHTITGQEYYGALGHVTGRRVRGLFLPTPLMSPLLAATGALIRLLPENVDVPLPDYGSVQLYHPDNEIDDAETVRVLDVPRRPLDQTLVDTIRWLVASGHLRASRAGRLATG